MLAERLDGVVINADSIQLYAALPILSASPQPDLTVRAPHRLYGCLQPERTTTAAEWASWARREIDLAHSANRQPIVVGGTGLYLEALTEGMSDVPPIPEEIRASARADLQNLGNEAFHARLIADDPGSGGLAAGDSHRIVRAWEVLRATGRPLKAWQDTRPADTQRLYRRLAIVPARAALYEACDTRFQRMIEGGALDEVDALVRSGGQAWPVMRTLGASFLADHLAGGIDLTTAIDLGQAATRHYAKRQSTWFRNRYARDARAEIFETPEALLRAI